MAKVPLTADHVRTGKFVLNAESVGISPEQFFRLCSDNPELRLEHGPERDHRHVSNELQNRMLSAEINYQLDLTEIWQKRDKNTYVLA